MRSPSRFAGVNRTLADIVTANARSTPHRLAVKDGAVVLDWHELDRRTTQLGHGLLAAGHRPGDRLSAWTEDGHELIELIVAGAKTGIVVSPISKMFTPREALVQLDDVEPSGLVFSPGTAGQVEELGLGPDVALYAAMGADRVRDAVPLAALVEGGSTAAHPPRDADELWMIGYTSGSTGRPKGSMWTHRTVYNMLGMQAVSYRLPLGGTAIFNLSMSFVGTITAWIWSHFYVGGGVVLAGGLDVDQQLDVVEQERGTWMYLPTPTMDEFLEVAARRPRALDPIQTILHSGSKAARAKVEAVCELVGSKYLEGYGQTEHSGGLVTATTAQDALGHSPARDVFASGGRPTVGVEIEILDEDGRPLPHDGTAQGELVYRSSALMAGYWRNEEAFEDALRGDWFSSGDIASIDEAGYVYIVDRRSDLVVSGGSNVSPLEVEEVLLALPGLAQCVVVGVPDDRWGSMVVAVVVPAPGQTLDPERLAWHCRAALASYKVPKRFLVTDRIALSASHKVRRFEVRDWAIDALGADPQG